MQTRKKPTIETASAPDRAAVKAAPKKEVSLKAVTGSGKINVDLSPSPSPSAAANQPAQSQTVEAPQAETPKSDPAPAVKTEPAEAAEALVEKAANEPTFTDAEQAGLKHYVSRFRGWMFVAAAIVVVWLGVLVLFAGGETPTAVATTDAAAAVPASDAVADENNDPSAPSIFIVDRQEYLVGEIIGALRSGAPKADPTFTFAGAAAEAAAKKETIAPVETPDPSVRLTLYSMITGALEQGQSEEYIKQMLSDAHSNGEVVIPPALLLADGSVDTSSIMAVFAN